MTCVAYPLGATRSIGYDSLGRPMSLSDSQYGGLVGNVAYGPAGELMSMSGTAVNESRTYNAMGQLTQLTGIGVNIKYNYAVPGANNEQIASQQDVLSGETIRYQYDALKRLSSASSTQGWGQQFVFDGFGNLTGPPVAE
jgi:hypothetical protein